LQHLEVRLFRIALFILPLLVACGSGTDDSGADTTDTPPTTDTDTPVDTGDTDTTPSFDAEAFYDDSCSGCHGDDGEGTASGPALTEEVPEITDEEIEEAILDGPRSMPSFEDTMTDEELKLLVAWIRAEFG